MSTTYTPDGQTAINQNYTLPQDVINDVTVETVNQQFTRAADNLAWLLLMMSGWSSVINHGAVGDGVANDTAAIQDAIDEADAAGGGAVFIPEGNFRHTGLTKPNSVFIFGVPGKTFLSIDHATNHSITMGAGVEGSVGLIFGVTFEALQTNTGNVISGHVSNEGLTLLVRCAMNQLDLSLVGRVVNAPVNAVEIHGGDWVSAKTSAGSPYVAAVLRVLGGAQTMAPAATANMFDPTILEVFGVKFTHVSTVGGISFVDAKAGSLVSVYNSSFSVNDSGAGSGTYAIDVNGGALKTGGNTMLGNTVYYKSTAVAAAGSDLQLLPVRNYEPAGTTQTVGNDMRSAMIRFTADGNPTITLSDGLFYGQLFSLMFLNDTPNNYSAVAMQPAPNIYRNGVTWNTSIDVGYIGTALFSWQRIDGDDYWVQVGAAGAVA